MLHKLARGYEESIAIWPFDAIEHGKTAIVEIYPSFFCRRAGVRRPSRPELRVSNYEILDKALHFYHARRHGDIVCRSVDQADALVSAAALRELVGSAELAIPEKKGLDLREGWIFGVALGSAQVQSSVA
jgi:hypothetical protein